LRIAGALTFEVFGFRPLRTSWLIVGTTKWLLSVGSGLGLGHRIERSAGSGGPSSPVEDGFAARTREAARRGHEGGV
jgi:hypothetical protein